MARSYGALKVSVWEPGSEFRNLTPLAQWAYAMLLSQPQVTNLGTLPYTPERWCRFAAGLTLQELEEAIDELGHGSFVIVDRDVGELLVRTFIKHDKVWQQPKLITNARRIISEVESETIRGYLTMRHPWLLDESTKEAVEKYEAAAAETPFDTPSHTPFQNNGRKPLSIPLSNTRAPARDAHATRAPAGPGPGPGPGAAAREKHSELQSESKDTARENDQPENLAAAEALEAPRPSAIRSVCSTWIADLRQVEPLALALTRGEFEEVVDKVGRRYTSGHIGNPAGLLMHLLREAVAQRERARIGQVTIATPAEQVLQDAIGYAKGETPIDVAAELIERKLRRLEVPEGERQALVDAAMQAYVVAANEEPDLAPPAGSVP